MGSQQSTHIEEESLRNTSPIDDSDLDLPTTVRRGASSDAEVDEEDAALETTGLYNVDGGNEDPDHTHVSACRRIWHRLVKVIFSENWLFLIFLGLLAALVGFGIDAAIHYLYVAQVKLTMLSTHKAVQYIVWVLWSLVFSVLAILPIILVSSNASGAYFCSSFNMLIVNAELLLRKAR